MCIEIYGLDPAHFLSAPSLAWSVALKNTKGKLYLLTDIDMLLMVKKVSDVEYVMLCINMRKLIINKYMKNYDKNKKSLYLQYWDVSNLYG